MLFHDLAVAIDNESRRDLGDATESFDHFRIAHDH